MLMYDKCPLGNVDIGSHDAYDAVIQAVKVAEMFGYADIGPVCCPVAWKGLGFTLLQGMSEYDVPNTK